MPIFRAFIRASLSRNSPARDLVAARSHGADHLHVARRQAGGGAGTVKPLTWTTVPQLAANAVSDTMSAMALPGIGAQYFFVCTEGLGHSSAWKSEPTFTDSGVPISIGFCSDNFPPGQSGWVGDSDEARWHPYALKASDIEQLFRADKPAGGNAGEAVPNQNSRNP